MIINPYIFGVIATSYIVDDYSPTAAYSLRKLSSSATVSIRVRRSSDNAEQDIGFTGNDLDTTSLSSFVGANNGTVVTWYNQGTSGATYDASQTTAANQPRLMTAGVLEVDALGNTSLDFGTLNCLLVFGSGALYYNKSYGAGFAVYENSASTRRDIWSWLTPTSGFSRFTSLDSFTTASRHELRTRRLDGDSISALVDTVNFPTGVKLRTDIMDWANADAFIRRDGVQVASSTSHGTAGSTSATDSRVVMATSNTSGIGKSATSSVAQFISEVVFFDTDVSSSISDIETNINSHYNLYWDGSQNGLFDTYPATAGYSLRNLSSSYTGALIRVRRSSDNAEQDIYGTYNGDLNTDALSSFVGANSGYIVTWYDQAGVKNATQATAANQPRIVNAGTLEINANGNPKIVFDGSNDKMSISALIPNTSTDIWSFLTSYESGGNYGIVKDAGATTWGWRTQGSTSSALDVYGVESGAVYQASKTLVTGEKIVVGNYDRNTEVDIWINNVSGTSGTPNNSNLRTATGNIDLGIVAGATSLVMETSEWILFLSDETSNRTAIETNINTYYGIY